MRLAYVLIAMILLGSCGLGYFIGAMMHRPAPHERDIIIQHKDAEVKWKTKYQTLLKKKQVKVPVPIIINNDSGECEDELETCIGNLNTIKNWCNVHCHEDLENCLILLRQAKAQLEGCYPWM